METVGSYEAKTHLPRLLEQVRQGEQFTITKHGVPVALLVPIAVPNRADIAKTIDQLKEFQQRHRLGDFSIREMINEGRRF